MLTTRIFQNGNSQAMRIPQELRTNTNEYCINKIDGIYIAYPLEDPWAPVRQVIGTFSDDYMADRAQPSWEEVSVIEEI